MAHVLKANGVTLLSGTTSSLIIPDWADVVSWTHCWDVKDAVTYADDGTAWSIPAATRVDSILDRGATGGMPAARDTGPYGAIFLSSPFPGPLYVASSARFNGRPAFFTDILVEGFWRLSTLLSPNTDPDDSDTWFNAPNGLSTPYWCAVLCRVPNGREGHTGAWDAKNGTPGNGTTVSLITDENGDPPHYWGATTSISVADWVETDVLQEDTDTTLVVCRVDGASSFMEINWRDAAGNIQTDRTNFTLTNYPAKELFFGWVHTSYVSAAGLKSGVPTEAEIDAIRNWAKPWIPASGSLAAEP